MLLHRWFRDLARVMKDLGNVVELGVVGKPEFDAICMLLHRSLPSRLSQSWWDQLRVSDG